MAAKVWSEGQSSDHESGDQAAGLDAQKKTLAASERREEERASFRDQVKELDASQLVFLDESGSNIGSPLGMREHPQESERREASRVIGARTRRCSPPCPCRASVRP